MKIIRFVLEGETFKAKCWRLLYAIQYRWPWIYPNLRGGRRLK